MRSKRNSRRAQKASPLPRSRMNRISPPRAWRTNQHPTKECLRHPTLHRLRPPIPLHTDGLHDFLRLQPPPQRCQRRRRHRPHMFVSLSRPRLQDHVRGACPSSPMPPLLHERLHLGRLLRFHRPRCCGKTRHRNPRYPLANVFLWSSYGRTCIRALTGRPTIRAKSFS